MRFDIRWQLAWKQIEFWATVTFIVAAAAFTLALINPVGAQTTLSNCDYLANVLAQCKATNTVVPPPVPPVATAPAFAVGVISGVSTTGVLTGTTVTSTTSVLLNFDGSQVQNAMTITPALGGGFFAQLPANFHDAKPHVVVAKAVNSGLFFDNANPTSGGNNGFSFTWK